MRANTKDGMLADSAVQESEPAVPVAVVTAAGAVFRASAPCTDCGNKYVQRYDAQYTPHNVVPCARRRKPRDAQQQQQPALERATRGVRMEDYAIVERDGLDSRYNREALLVVLADGHGSVPALLQDRRATTNSADGEDERRDTDRATRFIGGYECAVLASESVREYVRRVASHLALASLSHHGVARLLYDAFLYAQRRCEQETARGARPANDDAHAHTRTPAQETARLAQLMRSEIDGFHFRDLHANTMPTAPPPPPHCVPVADKVLERYDAAQYTGGAGAAAATSFITYYVDASGARRTLAEYGCTLTTALLLPPAPPAHDTLPSAGTLYVANAGDSDAYLFHRVPLDTHAARTTTMTTPAHRYETVRLTGDHSTRNASEAERLRAHCVHMRGHYYTLSVGENHGQSLMPSRAIGHTLLSKHGFCFEPSVSCTAVQHGDHVVVASDGLWSTYGKALAASLERHGTVRRARQGAESSSTFLRRAHARLRDEFSGAERSAASVTDEDLAAARVADLLAAAEARAAGAPLNLDHMAQRIRREVARSAPVRDNLALVILAIASNT